MNWLTLHGAEQIPAAWDDLASHNIFLKKVFLEHLEQTNPCQQSYNMLWDKGILKAIYVDYRLPLDLFTYRSICFKVPVRIMGIPCSVSKQGFAVQEAAKILLLRHFQNKKGVGLILNCQTGLPAKLGETLPTCRLKIKWQDFHHYLQSQRSHYRYRLQKALSKWAGVAVEYLPPETFTPEMYTHYEKVYDRSKAKLEKLQFDFFQRMPLPARIIKASHRGKLLGFAMVVENGEELIFLFTGFDHQLNVRFDTYLNLLLEILRFGIANGVNVIDFGQTAEETKMRLGCQLERRRMVVHHSNPLLNALAGSAINLLSYCLPSHEFHVFKQESS